MTHTYTQISSSIIYCDVDLKCFLVVQNTFWSSPTHRCLWLTQEAAKELREEAQRVIQRMQRQTEDAQKKSDGSMKAKLSWKPHLERIDGELATPKFGGLPRTRGYG